MEINKSPQEGSSMNKFRVMSFNIRNSRFDQGTIFSWKHRREKVIENIHYKF